MVTASFDDKSNSLNSSIPALDRGESTDYLVVGMPLYPKAAMDVQDSSIYIAAALRNDKLNGIRNVSRRPY